VATALEWALAILGEILIAIGAFFDVVAAIGLLRFPNFFVRLHAATIGAIGGAFVPLIGVALLAAGCGFLGPYRWFMAGAAAVTAVLILILAPVGSHILAKAAHQSRTAVVEPKVVDFLEEDRAARERQEGAGGGEQ